MPIATTGPGGVIVDGTTITINELGVISIGGQRWRRSNGPRGINGIGG